MADDQQQKPYLEMARALYSFKATVGKTLSFREHEFFLIYHPSTKERNWWQVVNAKAQVGYVPSNYVNAVQVSPEFMGEFIDSTIELIRREGQNLPVDRQELLTRLTTRRRRLDGSGSEEKGLSRTPSVISIPPPAKLGEIQSTTSVTSTPHERPASSPVEEITKTLPRPVKQKPKPVAPPVEIKKKPAKAEKSVSVKNRVAEFNFQMGEPGFGTLKKTAQPVVEKTEVTLEHIAPEYQFSETKSEERPQEVAKPPSRRCSRQDSISKTINYETVYQLVEQVRCHTDLSHEKSRIAVAVILAELDKYIPDHPILTSLLGFLDAPINAPKPLLEQTHDAQRLHVIFTELTSCKDDSQQRSWRLHEDEDVIIDYIKELTSILTNADASICRHVVSSDQYAGVYALAEYYQMETRWSIRKPLLTALGVLSGVDRAVVSILLTSVLPCELARDMVDNPDNVGKLSYSGTLLYMIFSMGEPMPVTHFDHLGQEFITFILTLIEDPPEGDERITDLFITLVLAYNLQFQTDSENTFTQALATRGTAKTFTEKILLLLNREDDPVRIFEFQPAPPHSVLKLFVDVFTHSTTASLFYTNDVKVLIDIIVRQLADLSPGDQRRHQYLCLCRMVMRNPGYSEHHHRRDDLLKCFTRIFCEETDISRDDQRLVREISNEFPQYFKA